MSLLTEFPSGYQKPEILNKSFDMIVRDWSRQQFGGDAIVEEIRKALNTGVYTQMAGTSTYGGGAEGQAGALRLENLDNTMTSVLATAEHLKVFRFLHKEPSKQPYYQWNRRESYGSTRGFFGFAEGGLPTGGTGQWTRNGAYIKFLGTKGGVTHPAVLTNILGGMSMDPVAEDQLGRTMDFMQRVERAIMFGDDDILDSTGGETNYDGLLKSLTVARSRNIIDMGGKPLTMDKIADVATRLVTEGKLLSFNDVTLFMSPQNIEDLGKLRYSTIYNQSTGVISGPGTTVDRADLTTSARQNLIAGMSIVGQATAFGVIPFEWSIFTEPVESGKPLNLLGNVADSGVTIAAPTDVTVSGGAAVTSTNSSKTSNFPAGGYYFYAVSSVTDAGETVAKVFGIESGASGSPSTWATAPISITTNQECVLTWTKVTGATAYRIYRLKVPSTATVSSTANNTSQSVHQTAVQTAWGTDSSWRLVGYVANPKASAPVTFTDRNGTSELHNNFMPDTNIAPLLCRNPADLCVAQMSPLLKMPLAPVKTTFEYLLLLYHTLVLKSPERQFIFKNVGALT